MNEHWRASIVIPAHDEREVIADCLRSLRDQSDGDLQVVVVANGCTDDTAAVARAFADDLPGLQVVETATPGKIAAMNAGDQVVTAHPRIYLDADIVLDPGTLGPMIDALETAEPRVATPSVRFDLDGCTPSVRSFYRVFARLPYVSNRLIGLGVYGMSQSGRARFDTFPDVTGDDLFAQRLFEDHERIQSPGSFAVRAPRTLADLVKVRTRIARGNLELADADIADLSAGTTTDSTLRALAGLVSRRPQMLLDALVYVGVTFAARRRAGRGEAAWLRDDSTRTRQAGPAGHDEQLEVAYLVSQYPAPSHVFIEREVEGLRARGARVTTFSVRSTPSELLLSEAMVAEAGRTIVVQSDKRALVRDTVALTARRPRAVLAAASRAAGTGEASFRGRLWQGFYLAEAVRVYAEMRRLGLRHLHVHFANNGADIARLVVELGREADGPDGGWRWSLTMHGPTEFEAVVKVDLAAKVRSADGVACISDFTRSQLMRMSDPQDWGKLQIVRMSVDTTKYSPRDAPREPDGRLRLLSVGRLVPEKGAPVLVEAIAMLVGRGIDVEARLVGSGPMESFLRNQIDELGLADHVELVGSVGQDALPELYRWADVFCLPSFQEGLPVVLMEAMASGVPVVTTTIAGIPELVDDGAHGRVVTPGRPDLVASALAELHGDPELSARWGRAGRLRVAGEFSVEVTSAAQLMFLRSVIPGSHPLKAVMS